MTETTSKDVASMAARIVGMSDALIRGLALRDPGAFRSVAASALTQAPDRPYLVGSDIDHPKPKRTRKAKVAP
jgi:hypothetical protein